MKQNKKDQAQEIVETPRLTPSPVMIDITGAMALSADDKRRIQHPMTGGVILFTRNWKSRQQMVDLTAEIKTLRPDILIAVDQEGGRVQRFKDDGLTAIPPMRALGELWLKGDMKSSGIGPLTAVDCATACGYVLAAELRACGVDFSFSPVLDLDWGVSDIIGDRAMSHDPRVVSLLARALMYGLKLAGMSNCGKHFPGHGFIEGDTHTEMPVDERPLERIMARDAVPYQMLGIALESVMISHVIYSQVDPVPAGYSKHWLQDILRGDLDFQGCIFSDDLSMAAARHINGQLLELPDAAMKALDAGCDMILVCNQAANNGKELDAVLDSLEQAHEKGRWQPSPVSEYRRQVLIPQTTPLPWDYLLLEPRYRQAKEIVADL